MRSVLFFLLIILLVSCNHHDTKQKETPPVDTVAVVKEKEPEPPVKDTAAPPALPDTASKVVEGEKEMLIGSISKKGLGGYAFNGPAVYLHVKKKIDGSYLFIAKAGEWGVLNINGKLTKLKFVKGYEDEATYANADYELMYDISYLNSPAVENPTGECKIRIKGKGYKTYRDKIWAEWGEN